MLSSNLEKKMGEGIDCVHRASSQLGLLKNPCDRLHLLNMFCIITIKVHKLNVFVLTTTDAMPAMNKLGCPNNWLRAGHKCYKFNTGASHTWQESSDACHRTNSRLLQITTKDQKVNQTMIFIDSYSQQQFCCMSRLSNNLLNTIEVFFYP